MIININTPSLLFPAISLLLLAYTNRFLAIASLVRSLHRNYQENPDIHLLIQIRSLRRRLLLIRNMQLLGTLSMLLCMVSMTAIFWKQDTVAGYLFILSLILMVFSLLFSLWELLVSIKALDIELQDLARKK
ncbi:MAG: DUF2721 domain-containing protein [Cytophagia bacterium]|nr:MAG: DUF2721 domain-containing protein [Cytophagales bacterium]TAF99778.1 MAG: DUF2721 domain-containing protein [Cytophagia bacterium]